MDPIPPDTLISLTARIVSAHASNNPVALHDLPALIGEVHRALAALDAATSAQARPEPAVPVRASIRPDHLICLEDGRKLKMLKRYLMARYRLTPDQYRARWGLPADYPMVAPSYADQRRALARRIGLGTRRPEVQAAP